MTQKDFDACSEKAAGLKECGYNCCQSVVDALSGEVEIDKETLHKLASGFSVGMGNMEGTCGSLIGAEMIAGLKSGGKGVFRISKRINENFRARSGAITCKELKSKVDGKVLCPCEDCVRNAVKAYFEVMSENKV
jgi:C_GCAxxG_C_C family probable redox protein